MSYSFIESTHSQEGPEVTVETRRHSPEVPWTYSHLEIRQREVAEQVRVGTRSSRGVLLISELAPVITLGRRTPPQDLAVDRERLSRLGIEVYPVDRGGLATYHGPGQWVIFPVDRLEALTGDPRGVRKAVETLLEIAWRVGLTYDPSAEIRTGCEMGVWTKRGKFAAVGVHIERGVLLHGLAVNGFRTATSFVGLRPCGLDAPVDFLIPDAAESEFQRLGGELREETLRRFWQKNAAHRPTDVDGSSLQGYKGSEDPIHIGL